MDRKSQSVSMPVQHRVHTQQHQQQREKKTAIQHRNEEEKKI